MQYGGKNQCLNFLNFISTNCISKNTTFFLSGKAGCGRISLNGKQMYAVEKQMKEETDEENNKLLCG